MLTYIVLVLSIALISGLLIHVAKQRRTLQRKSCYVTRKEQADYYKVESTSEYADRGFTKAQKEEIYDRAGGECELCGCETFLGEPKSRTDHAKGFLLGAKEGQAHHVIPRELRGMSEVVARAKWEDGTLDNAMWLCVDCNLAISDKWTREAERLCIQQGKTVYLKKFNGRVLASKELTQKYRIR